MELWKRTKLSGHVRTRLVEGTKVDQAIRIRHDLSTYHGWFMFCLGVAVSTVVGLISGSKNAVGLWIVFAVAGALTVVFFVLKKREDGRLSDAMRELDKADKHVEIEDEFITPQNQTPILVDEGNSAPEKDAREHGPEPRGEDPEGNRS